MNLCTYKCEATIVSKAVLDIPSIGEHCALLHALHSAQKNLSFRKLTMEQAVQQLVDSSIITGVKRQDVKTFATVVASRIRCMCRVVAQALAKDSAPKWIMEHLPWLSHPAEASATPAKKVRGKSSSSTGREKYVYAFDEEAMLCTRQSLSGGRKTKSLPLQVSDAEGEAGIAKFIDDDDVPHVAPGFSTRQLKVFLAARSSGSSVGPLWTGQQVGTKHTVTIQQKVDRHLLMSMFEQSRQVCQIRLDAFSPLPRKDETAPA